MHHIFYDDQGSAVLIGNPVGLTGQDGFFEIIGQPKSLAKIYAVAPDSALGEKLQRMVSLRADAELRQFCQWPRQLLRSESPDGPLVGFMTDSFQEPVRLQDLLRSSDRIFHRPQLHWKDLVDIAAKLANAVTLAHRQQMVIGDLHPENILVSPPGNVCFTHCDLWRMSGAAGNVGGSAAKGLYTPPERMAASDAMLTDRLPNDDVFALAVIVFQCLFPDQNPFDGATIGIPDHLIARDLTKSKHYSYGQHAWRKLIRPPAGTLNPRDFAPRLAPLFEKAFSQSADRPSAEQWWHALESLSRELVPCSSNKRHYYLRNTSSCPFCQAEQSSVRPFFPDVTVDSVLEENHSWSPSPIWRQPLPGPRILQRVSIGSRYPGVDVSPLPERVRKSLDFEDHICFLFRRLPLISLCHFISPAPTVWLARLFVFLPLALFVLIILSYVPYHLFGYHYWERRRLLLASYRLIYTASAQERRLQSHIRAAESRLKTSLGHLTEVITGFEDCSSKYRDFQDRLQMQQTEESRTQWLNCKFLSLTTVPGMTVTLLQKLTQSGIRSAVDVDPDRLQKIPDLTIREKNVILTWRSRLEYSFVPTPTTPTLTPELFAHEFLMYESRILREPSFEQSVIQLTQQIERVHEEIADRVSKINAVLHQSAVHQGLAGRIESRDIGLPSAQAPKRSGTRKILLALMLSCLIWRIPGLIRLMIPSARVIEKIPHTEISEYIRNPDLPNGRKH